MSSTLKVSSTQRDFAQSSVKLGGVQRTVRQIWNKVGGTVYMVWQALSVAYPGISVFNTLPGGAGTCVANVRLDSDGNVYTSNAAGSFSNDGPWLEEGTSAEVWCSRGAVSGGSLASDPWGSPGARLQMNVDRAFGISRTGVGINGPVTFDVTWYDAASGGNLLETTSVSLTASVEV